jgi:hypothetical protein
MTWIIGTAPPFGFSILVSDICVTFRRPDGTEQRADCLQKIYPLGPFVLGGFSGSVRIGFGILAILQMEFSKAPAGQAWNIDVAVNTWLPRLVRRVFRTAPSSEQALGSSIMLASAHPTRNRGDAPWPWTDIYAFSRPNFEPVQAAPLKVEAIGSGAAIDPYMNALRASCADFGFMQAAVAGEGAQAMIIAHRVSRLIAEGPVPGISTLFQIGLVTRGRHAVHNHEYTVHEADGTQVEFKFPPIARSWRELETLCRQSSWTAGEAIC